MSDVYYRPRVSLTGPGGDHTDPLQQNYKLYLFRRLDNATEVIYSDGPVPMPFDEGATYPAASLTFPPEYAMPLYQALAKDLGTAVVADASSLQEALNLERNRMDDQLEWLRSGELRIPALKDRA
jgi:hypothetical protein